VGVLQLTRLLPLGATRVAPRLLVNALCRWPSHEKDCLTLIEGELAGTDEKLPAALHNLAKAGSI